MTMEKARAQITRTVATISRDNRIPAFLMEGIVMEVLAEIRKQKAIELIADMDQARKEQDADVSKGQDPAVN